MTVSSTRFMNSTRQNFIEHVKNFKLYICIYRNERFIKMTKTNNNAMHRGATPAKKVPRAELREKKS